MNSDIQVRAATPADEAAISLIGGSSFGHIPTAAQRRWWRETFPLRNSRVAVSDGHVVGHTVTGALSLTVPGPQQVPAAGVSSVAVAATHRRRGVLRALLTEMHQRIKDSGVSLAILTASEGGIYGRFGYYTATLEHSISLDRRFASFDASVPDPGGVTIARLTEVRDEIKSRYAQWQSVTPGAQARPDADWEMEFADLPGDRAGGTELFALLHADGYVLYRYLGEAQRLRVHSLRAATRDAHCALWRTLTAFDLFDVIEAAVPAGDPLPYLLTNPRLVRTISRQDELWLRILDVPAALTARHYLADLNVVLDISDPSGYGGRFALRIRDGRAECQATKADPDVRLGIDVLAGLYLGTHAPAGFAAANRLLTRDADMVGLGAAFAAAREPQLGWDF